jgi:hypothetical protein
MSSSLRLASRLIHDDVCQLGFVQPGDATTIGGYQSRHLLKPTHLFTSVNLLERSQAE